MVEPDVIYGAKLTQDRYEFANNEEHENGHRRDALVAHCSERWTPETERKVSYMRNPRREQSEKKRKGLTLPHAKNQEALDE